MFVRLCSKQLAPHEAQEQQELRACLRWRRLQDEVQNSPEAALVTVRGKGVPGTAYQLDWTPGLGNDAVWTHFGLLPSPHFCLLT